MILDIKYEHTDYIKHILPFVKNGIFIDTSIMKMFFDGYINMHISKKINPDYEHLISLFDYLKTQNKWNKFVITPQILSEICQHLRCDYNKHGNYCDIINMVFPILKELREENCINKDEILQSIDLKRPILEMGDISIFVIISKRMSSLGKMCVLAKDEGIKQRYENDPNVLMIDFDKTILDLITI